jgi:hypothetical protein
MRTLLRTGAVAIGVLFGPELIFGSVAGGLRLIREDRLDQFMILMPVMAGFVACALWGFIAGHWYVCNWFLAIAVTWNMWGAFDVLARDGPLEVRAAGILWLVWSLRFFSLLMKRREPPFPGEPISGTEE